MKAGCEGSVLGGGRRGFGRRRGRGEEGRRERNQPTHLMVWEGLGERGGEEREGCLVVWEEGECGWVWCGVVGWSGVDWSEGVGRGVVGGWVCVCGGGRWVVVCVWGDMMLLRSVSDICRFSTR